MSKEVKKYEEMNEEEKKEYNEQWRRFLNKFFCRPDPTTGNRSCDNGLYCDSCHSLDAQERFEKWRQNDEFEPREGICFRYTYFDDIIEEHIYDGCYDQSVNGDKWDKGEVQIHYEDENLVVMTLISDDPGRYVNRLVLYPKIKKLVVSNEDLGDKMEVVDVELL